MCNSDLCSAEICRCGSSLFSCLFTCKVLACVMLNRRGITTNLFVDETSALGKGGCSSQGWILLPPWLLWQPLTRDGFAAGAGSSRSSGGIRHRNPIPPASLPCTGMSSLPCAREGVPGLCLAALPGAVWQWRWAGRADIRWGYGR